MRTPSDILTSLAASLRGVQDPQDTSIMITPQLVPTMELGSPIRVPLNNAAGNQASSFLIQRFVARAASAAALTDEIAFVRPGVWRFTWTLSHLFDFTQVVTAGPQTQFAIIDPGSVQANPLHVLYAIANQHQQVNDSLTLHLPGNPGDLWAFRILHAATGAGQTGSVFCHLAAIRII